MSDDPELDRLFGPAGGDGDPLGALDDDLDLVEDEEEDDFENEELIRAKWAMDGATTLTEAAAMLRSYADQLEQLEREGWQLVDAVSDDYGFLRQSGPVADGLPEAPDDEHA